MNILLRIKTENMLGTDANNFKAKVELYSH